MSEHEHTEPQQDERSGDVEVPEGAEEDDEGAMIELDPDATAADAESS